MKRRMTISLVLTLSVLLSLTLLTPTPRINAADHRDGPIFGPAGVSIDIDDAYFFLDPNDTTKVILALSVSGPIVPAENANAGGFDPTANFRFQIENTGDAAGDLAIDVTFSKQTGPDQPQTADVTLRRGRSSRGFTAPTTVSSATATTPLAPVITTDPATGISFVAGLADDPFFIDIPAELRYRASRFAGMPDPSFFDRGRDSFAGYNVLMIALSVPASLLRGRAGDMIGLSVHTQRNSKTDRSPDGDRNFGKFVTIDRMGIPFVNTVFVPFSLKDEYNRASTVDDANGRFASDIVNTLRQLHTDDTSIQILAQLAVTNGDMLRLDLSIANSGPGGGDNQAAGFPNGRRLQDDVIDKIVTLINNRVQQGDNVDGNDVPFLNTFPFFAPPTQPFPNGVIDDRTRN